MKSILTLLAASLIAIPTAAQTSAASDREELARLRATTQALIDALVAQGLLTRDKAEAILKQAQVSAAAPASQQVDATKPNVLRIPYVPETVRQQMRDEIKAEVLAQAKGERWGQPDALPDWVGRIRIGGDLRVRGQAEFFDKDANVPAEVYRAQTASPAWSPDLTNTTADRQRLTLRGRVEVEAKLSDRVLAGVRIATGSTGNSATSTSQTLGNDFNRYTLGLDRAFLRWQSPLFANGLSADFGRMPNPFYSTDLAWPDDIAFDGVAAKLSVATPRRGLFATAGVFPLEELNLSTKDKWLLGAQVGGEIELARGVQFKMGLAAYDFRHMEGRRETDPPPSGPRGGATNYFASQYAAGLRLKGNTLINLNDPTSTASPTWGLAAKFRPVNLTASLQLDRFLPVPVGLTLDWIKNTGFDRQDIEGRAGVPLTDVREKTIAAQARLQAGAPKMARRGDWQAFTTYRMVQRDAWIDGFTDTTWHLGGTNYKGWSLGGNVGLDKNFWLAARWTSTRNLDDGVRFLAVPGDPTSLSGNLSSAPLRIEVFQLDLNARF
jgi:hypothetical protein